MARRVPPGQLPLFGELPRTAPPPPPARLLAPPQGEDSDAPAPGELFAAPDRAVPEGWTEASAFEAPPAAAADRLVLAVPVSGRSGGSILAAIRQVERIVLDD